VPGSKGPTGVEHQGGYMAQRFTTLTAVHLWGDVEVETRYLTPGRYAVIVGDVQLFMTLDQLRAFAEQVAEIAAAHTADVEAVAS
jgi:hypothetical protein